jgi:hypothetical protein
VGLRDGHRQLLARIGAIVQLLRWADNTGFHQANGYDPEPFQFTKICSSPKLTIAFSGAKIYRVFSMIVCPYPQLLSMKSKDNPLFSSSSDPQYWHFIHQFTKCLIVPRRSYSRDKMPPHQANPNTSVLMGKLLPSCDENQNYAPWQLFATQSCLSCLS